MPQDIIKPSGPTKRNQPGGSGSNPQLVPLLGVVKDNIDPTRAGRIFVYLANNNGLDPENRENWRTVKFLSPFYGTTRGDAAKDDYGNYKNNPSSYGMWMSPPDIGTTVLCLFVNGDLNYGFYIGCVPEPESLQMVPAIGAVENVVPNEGEAQSYGGAIRLPVTNINKNNKAIADTADYLTAAKPVHSYAAAVMFQQGVLRDPIRGPISSSAQRETPSRVGWGINSPGRPIYEGGFDDRSIADNLKADKNQQLRVVSRRSGHSIVMDDGDIIGRDNLIRIRTSLGHQILMSDDGQTLMLLHSNGQSYIELGKEGTVDIYSTNSINLRTQGDLNLHADNNINIHANKDLNIQAENIQVNTEKEFKQRIGSDFSQSTAGKHTTKVNGAMSMQSGGDISMASDALAYVNGSKVLLNTGQTSTKPQEVPAIEKVLHTDTLFDKQKGYIAAPVKLVSITSRAPAHAPWANAGQGVDVKTDLNASSQLPQNPNTAVAATNVEADNAGVSNPANAAAVATAPNTSAASAALDKNTVSALAGQIATDAANGPLANAVTKGTAIAQTAQGTQVGVGKYALTPEQLEKDGILKPGSAAIVNAQAAATGDVKTALTDNLFTGKPGAENLNKFLNNPAAQTSAVVTNLKQAQTELQQSGAITGKESGSQIGGVILSAAKNGLGLTIGALKGSATNVLRSEASNLNFDINRKLSSSLGNFGNNLRGELGGVFKDISAGNFAAKLGESAGGVLGGLQTSLESVINSPSLKVAVNRAAGIATGAFSAIADSFKPLNANEPVNLRSIAKRAFEKVVDAGARTITDIGNKLPDELERAANRRITQEVSKELTSLNRSLTNEIRNAGITNKGNLADSLVNVARKTTNTIGGAINTRLQDAASNAISSLATAASTSEMFTNPNSLAKGSSAGADSLKQAAMQVSKGTISSVASATSSGLSNLPGGQSAVSSVTDLGMGTTPKIPGTGGLTLSLENKSTNALNSLGNNLEQQINARIAEKLDLQLDSPTTKINGLMSSLPTSLPSSVAAELQNAVSSIAAAGSGIKMPSIALNTNNRESVTEAVDSQLNDPKIPSPNFGQPSPETTEKFDRLLAERIDLSLSNTTNTG
jgi:hypothetical protein